MALYRNHGAAFRSQSGQRVGRGDVFEPTPQDLQRRAHKLRPVDDGTATPSRVVRGAATPPPPPPPGRYPGFAHTNFASDEAYELARSLGLGDMAFEGARGSGKDGAWTVGDVRTLVGEPDPEPERFPGFRCTDFASDKAYEIAREEGMGDSAFEPWKGSGKDGSFTVADVRGILEERKRAEG